MFSGGIRADFPITDLKCLLTYLHELLLKDGETTEYAVSSSDNYGIEDFDAKQSVEKVLEGSGWFGRFSLPDLKTPGCGVSADMDAGLQLWSKDPAWIRAQYDRWAEIAGQQKPAAAFSSKHSFEGSGNASYTDIFRGLAWLFGGIEALGSDASLTVLFKRSRTRRFAKHLGSATMAECPNCHVRHPRWICQELLKEMKLPPSSVGPVELELSANPRQTMIVRFAKRQLSVRVDNLDLFERLFGLWEEVQATGWDVDPASLAPATSPTASVEDGVAKGSLPVRGYEQASYFLLFKAACWMHAAGELSSIELTHSDPSGGFMPVQTGEGVAGYIPNERPPLMAPLELPAADATTLGLGGGFELPEPLCNALVLEADLGRVLQLRGRCGDATLQLDFKAKEVRVQAPEAENVVALLQAWQAIEARPLA